MRSISEMTASALGKCLCDMAEPAERLFTDGAVCSALNDLTAKLKEKMAIDKAFSLFTQILFPVICGDKHKADTFAILAALDGVTVDEIEKRNGLEVMRDLFKAFVLEGDVATIFRPGCEVRGE